MERALLEALDPVVRIVGLHVLRCMALLWALPFFGQGSMAGLLRTGLSIVLGALIASMRGLDLAEDPGAHAIAIGIAALREVVYGALLGWIINLLFDALRIAGALIATEMGLNMASQVDPLSNSQQTTIASILVWAGMVLFFASNAHVIALEALVRSFDAVPPGQFRIAPDLADSLVQFTSWVFLAGLRMAAPIFFILLIVTVSVAFLAKVAPQLHVLEASWPIRIISALLLLIVLVEPMLGAFDLAVQQVSEQLDKVIPRAN